MVRRANSVAEFVIKCWWYCTVTLVVIVIINVHVHCTIYYQFIMLLITGTVNYLHTYNSMEVMWTWAQNISECVEYFSVVDIGGWNRALQCCVVIYLCTALDYPNNFNNCNQKLKKKVLKFGLLHLYWYSYYLQSSCIISSQPFIFVCNVQSATELPVVFGKDPC